MRNYQQFTNRGRTETSTFQDEVLGWTRAIGIILLVALAGIWLTSCNSKSGHLADIKPEKVVVIDMYPDKDGQKMHQYKVNRFQKGVIDVIYDNRLLEQHDTIYHKFIE
jgi:predicted small secreted protein